jgi:hypothetical protein
MSASRMADSFHGTPSQPDGVRVNLAETEAEIDDTKLEVVSFFARPLTASVPPSKGLKKAQRARLARGNYQRMKDEQMWDQQSRTLQELIEILETRDAATLKNPAEVFERVVQALFEFKDCREYLREIAVPYHRKRSLLEGRAAAQAAIEAEKALQLEQTKQAVRIEKKRIKTRLWKANMKKDLGKVAYDKFLADQRQKQRNKSSVRKLEASRAASISDTGLIAGVEAVAKRPSPGFKRLRRYRDFDL